MQNSVKIRFVSAIQTFFSFFFSPVTLCVHNTVSRNDNFSDKNYFLTKHSAGSPRYVYWLYRPLPALVWESQEAILQKKTVQQEARLCLLRFLK